MEEDSGDFVCEAVNRFGRDAKRFSVSIEDVPSPPEGVSLTGVDSRTVEISWRTPSHDGNSHILNYVVEYATVVSGKYF